MIAFHLGSLFKLWQSLSQVQEVDPFSYIVWFPWDLPQTVPRRLLIKKHYS